MSHILQMMYANTKLQVRLDNKYGPEFEYNIRVNQGDPLSPLLFGLYIDRFVPFLRNRCPMGDVVCGNVPIEVILYADDMVLVSHDVAVRYLGAANTPGSPQVVGLPSARNARQSDVRDRPRTRFTGQKARSPWTGLERDYACT